ncbi:hypothetical protein EDB87DRAFT_678513 [Lactarius vividus]|nr:hypothetical protein EDB87DRAFT_678513 [Lactarius vividus]
MVISLASGRDPLVMIFCVVSGSAMSTRSGLSGTARLFTPPGITVALTVGADSTDTMSITSRVGVTDALDVDLWILCGSSCDNTSDRSRPRPRPLASTRTVTTPQASVAADAFDRTLFNK